MLASLRTADAFPVRRLDIGRVCVLHTTFCSIRFIPRPIVLSSDAALIQLKMLCIVRGGSENVAKRYEIAILFSFLKVGKEIWLLNGY